MESQFHCLNSASGASSLGLGEYKGDQMTETPFKKKKNQVFDVIFLSMQIDSLMYANDLEKREVDANQLQFSIKDESELMVPLQSSILVEWEGEGVV